MKLSETELKKRLIRLRKIIKRKLDILKHGEVVKEKMFSPITKHLKEIESKLGNTVSSINKSVKNPQEQKLKTEPSAVTEENSHRLDNIQPSISREIFETPKASRGIVPQNIFHQLSTPRSPLVLSQNEDDDPEESKMSILDNINQDIDETSSIPINEEDAGNISQFANIAKSYVDYLDQYDPLHQ